MQPTLCSRCHKMWPDLYPEDGGRDHQCESLCLKCAKEMGIKPVEDMAEDGASVTRIWRA